MSDVLNKVVDIVCEQLGADKGDVKSDSSFVEVPRDVAEDGNDFITIDELISIKLNDSSYNKSSKIYRLPVDRN